MDQSKKTMRHFYCRDVLWETFEQMANDFDCSIDYLINEAMRFYARSKNYQAGISSQNLPQAQNGPQISPGQPTRSRAASIPPAPPQAIRPASVMPLTPQPTPAFRAPRGASPFASPRVTAEPAGASAPMLFLLFNGQRIAIDKEQFIIGRGSKTSDLAIKDGNISRKHAAIIRRNGLYYIKDLGSTNGIDCKGMRIDNKRIDEGDVFHICDYELRFTYR
jgi:hypothetical protein